MSFKKIIPEVKEALERVEITELQGFGAEVFAGIKAGGNLVAVAPKNSGKTKSVVVATFNKVNQQYEGSPRVLLISSTIDEACRVYEIMNKVAWPLDVTVDLAHDKGDMILQRNEIFNGTEIVVGTPRRIYDLYIQNGINFNLLEYLIIDDFDEILVSGRQMEIKRMFEALNKTQLIFLASVYTKKMEQFVDSLELPFRMILNDD